MRTQSMMVPAGDTGDTSPYPTVLIVTIVSQMDVVHVGILSRGSNQKISVENTIIATISVHRSTGRASTACSKALKMRCSVWNRRNVFIILSVGNRQRKKFLRTESLGIVSSLGPAARRRVSTEPSIKSSRLNGLVINITQLGHTMKRTRNSTKNIASTELSKHAAPHPWMIGGSVDCIMVQNTVVTTNMFIHSAYKRAALLDSWSSRKCHKPCARLRAPLSRLRRKTKALEMRPPATLEASMRLAQVITPLCSSFGIPGSASQLLTAKK
mmetsp:Transcript_100116/g.188552  ORF Transcript_100116/g.188552 Transcript_100116/m.188552 type:complete len:270 (-) Transcript_100116:939-1748(-)